MKTHAACIDRICTFKIYLIHDTMKHLVAFLDPVMQMWNLHCGFKNSSIRLSFPPPPKLKDTFTCTQRVREKLRLRSFFRHCSWKKATTPRSSSSLVSDLMLGSWIALREWTIHALLSNWCHFSKRQRLTVYTLATNERDMEGRKIQRPAGPSSLHELLEVQRQYQLLYT